MGDWVILFEKNLFSRPYLQWWKMIALFQRTYKTINSMSNLFHSWTAKLFFSKITFPQKSHECTSTLEDYKTKITRSTRYTLFSLNGRKLNIYNLRSGATTDWRARVVRLSALNILLLFSISCWLLVIFKVALIVINFKKSSEHAGFLTLDSWNELLHLENFNSGSNRPMTTPILYLCQLRRDSEQHEGIW